MARIKKQPVKIEFTAEYAGKQVGYIDSFMPDLAAAIVRTGKAKYYEPVKQTKLKTSKKKKDEKNNDDIDV